MQRTGAPLFLCGTQCCRLQAGRVGTFKSGAALLGCTIGMIFTWQCFMALIHASLQFMAVIMATGHAMLFVLHCR